MQTFFNGSFDPDKDAPETSVAHGGEQNFVIGQVQAGLSDQGKRIAVVFLPLGQRRHELTDIFLIPDEIVVNNKDCPAPAKISQSIKLGQYLLIALGARDPSVDFNDVAELARERTSARILN